MKNLPSDPDTVILWNYNCSRSKTLAERLEDILESRQYGSPDVYVSDPNDFPRDASGATLNPWYPAMQELVERAPHVIVLVSPVLSSVKDSARGGMGLLAEILHFVHRDQSEPGFASKLIPICIGCAVEDLESERGHYEQLQDIAVPFIAALRPMVITSEAVSNDNDVRALAAVLAERMGLVSLSKATGTKAC
jgi:hypothetical protein